MRTGVLLSEGPTVSCGVLCVSCAPVGSVSSSENYDYYSRVCVFVNRSNVCKTKQNVFENSFRRFVRK